jgi:hypothetical protein
MRRHPVYGEVIREGTSSAGGNATHAKDGGAVLWNPDFRGVEEIERFPLVVALIHKLLTK